MIINGFSRMDKQLFADPKMKDIIEKAAKIRVAREIGNFLADHLDCINFNIVEDDDYFYTIKGEIDIN